MKHRSSQILFAHWNERRREHPLPERGEIDPGAIRAALGDTFILAFNELQKHPFRLAGTRVCALFGRELKETPFVRLWSDIRGESIGELIRIAADESLGVVAGASGRTAEGDSLELELLLLPLRHWGRTHVRLIGTLAAMSRPYWLGTQPLRHLTLGDYRYVDAEAALEAWPRADNVIRLRNRLIVYQGGQA